MLTLLILNSLFPVLDPSQKKKKKKLNEAFSTTGVMISCCKSTDTHEQIKAQNPSVTINYPRVCLVLRASFGAQQSTGQYPPTHLHLCQLGPWDLVVHPHPLSQLGEGPCPGKHLRLHLPHTSLETAQLTYTAVAFQISLLEVLITTHKQIKGKMPH